MIRFSYRGFHGNPAVCGLEIKRLADGRTLVICAELPDNPGTSVTNFAEDLATLVCDQLAISPDKLVWVEHYPPSRMHGRSPDWDLVEFQFNGTRFTSPHWRPMSPEDWKQLGMLAPVM